MHHRRDIPSSYPRCRVDRGSSARRRWCRGRAGSARCRSRRRGRCRSRRGGCCRPAGRRGRCGRRPLSSVRLLVVVSPRIQSGCSIQASIAAPITASRSIRRRIMVVVELAVARHQGAAVGVAGQDRAAGSDRAPREKLSSVRWETSRIIPSCVHQPQQLAPLRGQRPGAAGAKGVGAGAVVGQPDRCAGRRPTRAAPGPAPRSGRRLP